MDGDFSISHLSIPTHWLHLRYARQFAANHDEVQAEIHYIQRELPEPLLAYRYLALFQQ